MPRTISNTQKGFTMFEALIYIALFAVVIGGGVISAYNIFEGSANIKAKAQQEMELNFVMRKLDWLLNGSSSTVKKIVSPPIGDTEPVLFVNKGTSQYRLRAQSGAVTLRNSTTGSTTPLTNNTLNVTDMTFEHLGPDPHILNIGIEIDGQHIGTTTRYVRTD